MIRKNKKNSTQMNLIYKKIFRIYPFLTKAEKSIFEKKSKNILDKFKKNNITSEEAIKEFLSFLDGNEHADIREYHKPDCNFMRKVKPQRIPSFELKNRILYIKIPSWLIWLGKIDKKLNGFCQKNINKYDAVIIDVRENQGGASKIAHNFAGIFFKRQVVFGKFIKRGKGDKLITVIGKLEPNKKIFIDKPVAILISRKCFSSNELFLAPFKISKRAVLIGELTRGGSANPISEIIKLSGKKFIVRIPTWKFFLKGKKQPIEKTKIRPDIYYNGKDIEKSAEKYLLKKIKQYEK
ncbi:MAG: S41 family peptidase [Nanoarchaeota archaeon]|nr:S41 family peptidase [Nanoarchaeota archaeon]